MATADTFHYYADFRKRGYRQSPDLSNFRLKAFLKSKELNNNIS